MTFVFGMLVGIGLAVGLCQYLWWLPIQVWEHDCSVDREGNYQALLDGKAIIVNREDSNE